MLYVVQVFTCLSDEDKAEFMLCMKLGHVVVPRDYRSRGLCTGPESLRSSPASSSSRVGSIDKGLLKRQGGRHDSRTPTHAGTFAQGLFSLCKH